MITVCAEHEIMAARPPVRGSGGMLHREILASAFERSGEPSESPGRWRALTLSQNPTYDLAVI